MIRPLALLRIVVPIYALFLLIVYLRRGSSPKQDHNVESTAPLEILIPKTVHQLLISMPKYPISTYKPSSHSISWQQSGWKVEYWSEDSCAELADELSSSYSKAFQQMPSAVLRSDFCRYMIMFGRGGVYNDLDVHLMKALPWKVMGPSREGNKGPPSLIVGLEGDGTTKGLPRSPQFVQWTIASAASHPVLQDAMNRIAERTPAFLKQQQADKNGDADVMNWTGPSVWTDAILAYLDCTEPQLEKLRDLKTAVRIKDVLILPKRAFAVIQGEDHSSPDILVKHYFSGTWKNQKSWISRILPFG
jgi:alpha 1,6-mannosyltransferase